MQHSLSSDTSRSSSVTPRHDRYRSGVKVDASPTMPGRKEISSLTHAEDDAPARDRAAGSDDQTGPCARVREHMVNALGHNRVRRYLSASTAMRLCEDGSLEVSAGDSFTLDMIQRRLGDALRIGAQFALGTTEPRVRFIVDPSLHAGAAPEAQAREGAAGQARHPLATRVPASGSHAHRVPACPTLEHFIVGAPNLLALESVKQAVQSTAACPPVFVHGSCGVGKTHLLRGATAYARRLRPGCKVRYVTGESFTNAFVNAIRTRTVEAFQKKYRGLDLLCIDDIHLMAGKQATQHELLQIFNTLSLGGARIILASDAHPREIARLDQALASRFAAGLVVRVEEPDAELARRLVTHIAHKRGVFLDEAAVRIIVERVGVGRGASVRDLEGAVVQIQAVARLMDQSARSGSASGSIAPTMNQVRQALSLRANEDDGALRGPVAVETIIGQICSELTVSKGDLLGKGRQKKVVLARELIVHLSRQLTSKSFPEIAHAIGRPNHSTVITAAKRFKDRLGRPDPIAVDCPHDGMAAAELAQLLTSRINQRPA